MTTENITSAQNINDIDLTDCFNATDEIFNAYQKAIASGLPQTEIPGRITGDKLTFSPYRSMIDFQKIKDFNENPNNPTKVVFLRSFPELKNGRIPKEMNFICLPPYFPYSIEQVQKLKGAIKNPFKDETVLKDVSEYVINDIYKLPNMIPVISRCTKKIYETDEKTRYDLPYVPHVSELRRSSYGNTILNYFGNPDISYEKEISATNFKMFEAVREMDKEEAKKLRSILNKETFGFMYILIENVDEVFDHLLGKKEVKEEDRKTWQNAIFLIPQKILRRRDEPNVEKIEKEYNRRIISKIISALRKLETKLKLRQPINTLNTKVMFNMSRSGSGEGTTYDCSAELVLPDNPLSAKYEKAIKELVIPCPLMNFFKKFENSEYYDIMHNYIHSNFNPLGFALKSVNSEEHTISKPHPKDAVNQVKENTIQIKLAEPINISAEDLFDYELSLEDLIELTDYCLSLPDNAQKNPKTNKLQTLVMSLLKIIDMKTFNSMFPTIKSLATYVKSCLALSN